jgi:hypothetical protein
MSTTPFAFATLTRTHTSAPAAAAAPAEEGSGIGSAIGDLAGGVAKKGIGGKLLGGLKAGGAMLGKGALAAGKLVGGALLSKPALIAGGVALAGYGAYKGYKALTSKDEEEQEQNPFVEKAKGSPSFLPSLVAWLTPSVWERSHFFASITAKRFPLYSKT